jgi:galactofuranose transport system substrate-binding protein
MRARFPIVLLLLPLLFLGLGLGPFLGGCGRAPKGFVVGFSQIGAESAWRVAETESIREEAAKRGIELKLADAGQKLEAQVAALHAFLAQGVGAVILAPQRKDGFEPALRELAAARIPVVVVDRGLDCDPALYATLIASDFTDEGRRAAEWLLAHTQGEVRIAELEGTAGSDPAIERKRGFDERIAKEPRMRIVKSVSAEFQLPKGKEAMEAIWKAEGGGIDAVYAHNDDMALGAIQAIEEAGKKPGADVLVVSIDATRGAFDAIVAGKLSCAVECSPLLGPAAFDAIERLRRGEPVEKRIVVQDRVFDATNAAGERPNRKY